MAAIVVRMPVVGAAVELPAAALGGAAAPASPSPLPLCHLPPEKTVSPKREKHRCRCVEAARRSGHHAPRAPCAETPCADSRNTCCKNAEPAAKRCDGRCRGALCAHPRPSREQALRAAPPVAVRWLSPRTSKRDCGEDRSISHGARLTQARRRQVRALCATQDEETPAAAHRPCSGDAHPTRPRARQQSLAMQAGVWPTDLPRQAAPPQASFVLKFKATQIRARTAHASSPTSNQPGSWLPAPSGCCRKNSPGKIASR